MTAPTSEPRHGELLRETRDLIVEYLYGPAITDLVTRIDTALEETT